MKFLIVSNAPIIKKQEKNLAYNPYVREMEIWVKYADEVAFCCPLWRSENGLFVSEIPFPIHKNFWLFDFNITSVNALFKAFFQIPLNFLILFKAMIWADHIHLRCPGNVGLLASFIQILFPWKKKTAKYAGNWDPKSKQPWSYLLQKWILSNTFLTRNMQVLVYGEWPNQTRNIKPFFTATYSEKEIQNSEFRIQNKLLFQTHGFSESRTIENQFKFLFVGTLSPGKQPLYAIQLVEELHKKGRKVMLELYGEGVLRKDLEQYIAQNNLEMIVVLKGNQTKETVLKAYQNSDFLILPSKSEGWPKVVAEAMFWGCVPLVTAVSCVPFMLGNGKRGVVLRLDEKQDQQKIVDLFNNPDQYHRISNAASNWSRQYTTDYFEREIAKLVKQQ